MVRKVLRRVTLATQLDRGVHFLPRGGNRLYILNDRPGNAGRRELLVRSRAFINQEVLQFQLVRYPRAQHRAQCRQNTVIMRFAVNPNLIEVNVGVITLAQWVILVDKIIANRQEISRIQLPIDTGKDRVRLLLLTKLTKLPVIGYAILISGDAQILIQSALGHIITCLISGSPDIRDVNRARILLVIPHQIEVRTVLYDRATQRKSVLICRIFRIGLIASNIVRTRQPVCPSENKRASRKGIRSGFCHGTDRSTTRTTISDVVLVGNHLKLTNRLH